MTPEEKVRKYTELLDGISQSIKRASDQVRQDIDLWVEKGRVDELEDFESTLMKTLVDFKKKEIKLVKI